MAGHSSMYVLALAGVEQASGLFLKKCFQAEILRCLINRSLLVARNTRSERLTVSPCGWNCCDSIFVIRFVTCHTSGWREEERRGQEERRSPAGQQDSQKCNQQSNVVLPGPPWSPPGSHLTHLASLFLGPARTRQLINKVSVSVSIIQGPVSWIMSWRHWILNQINH